MEWIIIEYKKEIPLESEHKRNFVQAVINGNFSYKDLVSVNDFRTTNGSIGQIWDYIYKQVEILFSENRFEKILIDRNI